MGQFGSLSNRYLSMYYVFYTFAGTIMYDDTKVGIFYQRCWKVQRQDFYWFWISSACPLLSWHAGKGIL